MTESKNPVKLELRVDWSELDYFGHVNNVSFFKYIQSARVHYWDNIGLTQFHLETQIGPMLASCRCDFKKTLFYPGSVRIFSSLEFIKSTSFGFTHTLLNDSEEIVAEAHDVMVMFDFNKNEKVVFPAYFKERIEKLENRKL